MCTLLALSPTTFAVIARSSGNTSAPPKYRLISSQNSTQQFSLCSVTANLSLFTIFRFLVSNLSCTPTPDVALLRSSPQSPCNLLSLSGMPSYIWHSPHAFSFLHSYASLLEIPVHHSHFNSCRKIDHHLSFCVCLLVAIHSRYILVASVSFSNGPLKSVTISTLSSLGMLSTTSTKSVQNFSSIMHPMCGT